MQDDKHTKKYSDTEELRRLLGDGVSEVSIPLPSEDLEKCKAFLDSEGMAYKISRGF